MLHHSSLTTCTQAIYFAALENRAKIVENIGSAEDMITAILGAEDVAGVPYESFATVGEIRVWWRADFQSGSRVLRKVF